MRALAMVPFLVACGGGASGIGSSAIHSDFATDAEGWQIVGFDTDDSVYTMTAGGTPEAATWDPSKQAIERMETFYGEGDYFSAPAKFLGDLSSHAGGTLRFSILESDTSEPFTAALVVLQTSTGTRTFPSDVEPTLNVWTPYSVPLDDSWTGGAAALSNVTGFYIRGEFSSAIESSWLDSVELD
jgi:hypothetical protein